MRKTQSSGAVILYDEFGNPVAMRKVTDNSTINNNNTNNTNNNTNNNNNNDNNHNASNNSSGESIGYWHLSNPVALDVKSQENSQTQPRGAIPQPPQQKHDLQLLRYHSNTLTA
ncbi:myb transcription factor, partial [Reticulomyxa filosa]